MSKYFLILLASITIMGCSGNMSSSGAVAVRDSAGVRIVEHPASFAAGDWRLAESPSLSIGSEDADDFLDRVRGIHRMSDGRIVVANHGTRQLKYFDGKGSLVRNSSREGEGPGELSSISWSITCGADSVYVWDSQLGRLSVFDPTGEFVRSMNLRLEDGSAPIRDGVCGNGMLLMQRRLAMPQQEGAFRERVGLVIFGPDGRLAYDLGEFTGSERYFAMSSSTSGSIMPRPLGKTIVYALGDRLVYVGTADGYELRVLTVEGELLQIVRWERSDLRITQAHVDRYVGDLLDGVTDPERRRRNERFFSDMEYPDTFPAYARLLLDTTGNLWVQDFVKPGDSSQTWNIFASGGEQLGRLSVPSGLRVYEAGDSYVLGLATDAMDVEYVQLFELTKPE